MNVGRDVMFLLGGAVALVIGLTMVSGGKISLGTAPSGPYLNLGYAGPQYKG